MDKESRKQEYYRARGAAKRAIFKAKDAERKKFCEDLEGEDRKGNVFRLVKQLVSKNRDVVSASCVKDDDGKIVVEEDKLMEVWRAHYDRISYEEFAWDRNGLGNQCKSCVWALREDFSFGSGCSNWKDEARQGCRSYRGCGRDAQGCG